MESDLPLLPDGNATLNAAEVGDDAQTPQCGSARAAVRSGVMHALTGLWARASGVDGPLATGLSIAEVLDQAISPKGSSWIGPSRVPESERRRPGCLAPRGDAEAVLPGNSDDAHDDALTSSTCPAWALNASEMIPYSSESVSSCNVATLRTTTAAIPIM